MNFCLFLIFFLFLRIFQKPKGSTVSSRILTKKSTFTYNLLCISWSSFLQLYLTFSNRHLAHWRRLSNCQGRASGGGSVLGGGKCFFEFVFAQVCDVLDLGCFQELSTVSSGPDVDVSILGKKRFRFTGGNVKFW